MVNDTCPECDADHLDLQVGLSTQQTPPPVLPALPSVVGGVKCLSVSCGHEGITGGMHFGYIPAEFGVQAGVFGRLAPAEAGIIAIRYRQVACQPPGGIQVVVTHYNGPGLYLRVAFQVCHRTCERCLVAATSASLSPLAPDCTDVPSVPSDCTASCPLGAWHDSQPSQLLHRNISFLSCHRTLRAQQQSTPCASAVPAGAVLACAGPCSRRQGGQTAPRVSAALPASWGAVQRQMCSLWPPATGMSSKRLRCTQCQQLTGQQARQAGTSAGASGGGRTNPQAAAQVVPGRRAAAG